MFGNKVPISLEFNTTKKRRAVPSISQNIDQRSLQTEHTTMAEQDSRNDQSGTSVNNSGFQGRPPFNVDTIGKYNASMGAKTWLERFRYFGQITQTSILI